MNRTILLLLFLVAKLSNAQVGIGTNQPHKSSDLEMGSSDKALILNRVEVDVNNNPLLSEVGNFTEGMLFYDATNQCVRAYEDNNWGKCLSGKLFKNEFVCGHPENGKVVFQYDGEEVTYGTIFSASGRCWLDRNLGASRAALAYDDSEAMGDFFQWGRGADGHQKMASSTTNTLATSSSPAHANFILSDDTNDLDWLSSQNDLLWQGLNGVNNPCPTGFRIPTEQEFQEEMDVIIGGSFNVYNVNDFLRFTHGGFRHAKTGKNPNYIGILWTSTTEARQSKVLMIAGFGHGQNALPFQFSEFDRANGVNVRCIKD